MADDWEPVSGAASDGDWAPVAPPAPPAAAAPEPPLPPSKGLLDRLYQGYQSFENAKTAINAAADAGIKEGMDAPPVVMSDEHVASLRKMGIFADPESGTGGPIRFMNEAIIRPVAGVADAAVRLFNAGLLGGASAVGETVKQATGDDTQGEKAKREAINAANYLMVTAGGVNPIARAERTAAGVVHDAPVGSLPTLSEFDTAAAAIKAPEAAPVLKQLYHDKGILPAEVFNDAQIDPTISQDLITGKVPAVYGELPKPAAPEPLPVPFDERPAIPAINEGRDLTTPAGNELTPAEGGGAGGGEPPAGNALPNDRSGQQALPGAAPTIAEDQASILKKVSVGDHDIKHGESFDTIYTKFVDDLNPIHTAVKDALAETPGAGSLKDLPTGENPYELFRLTRGVAGKADQFLMHGTFNAASYKTNGVGLRDVLSPLKDIPETPEGLSSLNQFRAYVASKRTVELADRGVETGMDVEAARRIVDNSAQKATFDAVHRSLVDYQNRLSMYLRDAGLVTPKAYDAMLKANEDYVPFYRFLDRQGAAGPRGTGKTLGSKNPLKKIEGSDAAIVDPIESVIKNTYAYLGLAEKNMAGVKLVDMLKAADDGGTFTRDLAPPEAGAVEPKPRLTQIEGPGTPALEGEVLPPNAIESQWKAGEGGKAVAERPLIETAKDTVIDAEFTEIKAAMDEAGVTDPDLQAFIKTANRVPEGENITVFRDGLKETYKVGDPELLKAWKGLDEQTVGTIAKLMAPFSKSLRAGATTLLPDFVVKNAMRDFVAAFVNTKGALFSPIDTFRGAAELIRKGESYQNWLKGGGANAALVSLDRKYIQTSIMELTKETGLGERAWNLVKSPLEGLRMASELAENATRLGEFMKAMREGDGAVTKEAIQGAAFRSREVTLDFSRIGTQMRSWNMISAFANAQIQGTDRLLRAFKDAPASTALRVQVGITLPSLLLWSVNHDNPRYQELPEWEKAMFYHFITDKWEPADPKDPIVATAPDYLKRTVDGKLEINNGHIFRVPRGDYTAGVIFGRGAEVAAETYLSQNPKLLPGFISDISQSVMPNFLPTLAVPMAEQFANKSTLTGGPLVPDRNMKLLPEYRYTQNTTELAKAIGRVAGAIPGVESAAVGGNALALSVTTPALLENYVREWTGGAGMYVAQVADLALRKAGALPDPTKPAMALSDIPFVKSFVSRYPSAQAQSIQDFYERNSANAMAVDTIKAKMKEGDFDAIQRIRDMEGDRVKLDGVQKGLATQESLIRSIYLNKDMTANDKRQNIDGIYYTMMSVAKVGNKMLDALDEQVAKARQ